MASVQNTSAQSKAAIYVRVSTSKQEDGTSLESQEMRCRAYATEHGYVVDPSHVYVEVHTGVELWERPALTRIRDAIRRHEVDVVVTYAIDRLSRDPIHLGVVLSEAEHHHARIEFVSEPLDNSPEGQLLRYVRGYAAKVEHEKIRERVTRARQSVAAKGSAWSGGKPLYGYSGLSEGATKETRFVRYVADPLTAPIVQRIFQMTGAGMSTYTIAKALTDGGIPSPGGRPNWQHTAVRRILTNTAYIGRKVAWYTRTAKNAGSGKKACALRDPSEWVTLPETTVPALVAEDIFALAQHRLATGKQWSPRNNSNPEAALLRGGFAKCGYCGYTLVAAYHVPSAVYYYRCGSSGRVGSTCHHTIHCSILDDAVWSRIDAIRHNPALIAQQLALQDGVADTTDEDLAAVDRSDKQLERQQSNLIDSLARVGAATAGLIEGKLAVIEKERERLSEERTKIQARQAAHRNTRQRIRDLEHWCETAGRRLDGFTYDQKRLALDAFAIEVRLWRADHSPRFEITASPDLVGPIVDRARSSTCRTSASAAIQAMGRL
jgi:site-specific DNA recombinase